MSMFSELLADENVRKVRFIFKDNAKLIEESGKEVFTKEEVFMMLEKLERKVVYEIQD